MVSKNGSSRNRGGGDGSDWIPDGERWVRIPEVWLGLLSGCTATEILVLLAIASCANRSGRAYPSRDTLGVKALRSERHVTRSIGTLCRLGLMRKARNGAGRQSSIYQLICPRRQGGMPQITPQPGPDCPSSPDKDVTQSEKAEQINSATERAAVEELKEIKIDEHRAIELVKAYGVIRIAEVWELLLERGPSVKNKAGFVIDALEKNYAVPPQLAQRARDKHDAAMRAAEEVERNAGFFRATPVDLICRTWLRMERTSFSGDEQTAKNWAIRRGDRESIATDPRLRRVREALRKLMENKAA